MISTILVKVKKIITFPKWNNPIYNWHEIKRCRKQLAELPGGKELIREEQRNTLSFIILFYGGLILFAAVANVVLRVYVHFIKL